MANVLIVAPTMPFVLERCKDVDFRVRRQTFEQIMKEIDISNLTVDQRKSILKSGLYDRYVFKVTVSTCFGDCECYIYIYVYSDERVKNACIKLLYDYWMKRVDENPILVKSICDIQIGCTRLSLIKYYVASGESRCI